MLKALFGIAIAVWSMVVGFIVGYGTVYASIITPQSVETMIRNVKDMNLTEQDKREIFLNNMLKDSPRPTVGIATR